MKNPTKSKRTKLATIVVRGCVMRLSPKRAREIVPIETALTRADWAKNQID